MQQKYEIIYILDPATSTEDAAVVSSKVEQIIADSKGTVIKKDEWGKRRLAYMVKKQRDGLYTFFSATVDAAAVAEITRNLRLFEKVIKFMIIKDDFTMRKAPIKKIKLSALHGASHPTSHSSAPRPGSSAPSSSAPSPSAVAAAVAASAAAAAPAPVAAPVAAPAPKPTEPQA